MLRAEQDGWLGRFAGPCLAERIPALDGLRGVFVLVFFLYVFLAQFDPAKIGRVASAHARLLLEGVEILAAACLTSRELACVLAGFFLGLAEPAFPGLWLRRRATRLWPALLAAVTPMLAYTGAGAAQVTTVLAFAGAPEGGPRFLELLFPVVWGPCLWVGMRALLPRLNFGPALGLYFLALLFVGDMPLQFLRDWAGLAGSAPVAVHTGADGACGLAGDAAAWLGLGAGGLAGSTRALSLGLVFGLAAARLRTRLPAWLAGVPAGVWLGLYLVLSLAERFAPSGLPILARQGVLALAVVRLSGHPGDRSARLLAWSGVRFYGLTGLSFFLMQTTWGLRLSRSLLSGRMEGLGTLATHFVLSFALSSLAAAFFWRMFERPALLRKAPPAAKDLGCASKEPSHETEPRRGGQGRDPGPPAPLRRDA